MKQRIEFNMHSYWSRINGTNSAREIIDRAVELGMDTIAITDIGSVKSLPSAYDYIKMYGKKIKLILGMEAYFKDGKIYCEVENEDEYSRIIILVKNEAGRKNLYKFISAYCKYGYAELTTREGLLIGTNGINSEIYHSIVINRDEEDVYDAVRFYDFILVDPMNYDELVQHIVDISDYTETLVIASNSPYYLKNEHATARAVLRFADGKDTEEFEDLSFYSTEDMLSAFHYLGDKAEDIVINNGYKLAEMVEDVPPYPPGHHIPKLNGVFEVIKDRVYKSANSLYGCHLPELISTRIETELSYIEKYDHEIIFFIAMKIADDSKSKGFPVISRGASGSSFVAYLLGLTHVNPLKPHYHCTQCCYTEFVEYCASGFDLHSKVCPYCGNEMNGDGHNIPYETMFGFGGGKEPDIDLNLSPEYYDEGVKFIKNYLGNNMVINAGGGSFVTKRNAISLVEKYLKNNGNYSKKKKLLVAEMCRGAFCKTTVQPCKFFIIPPEYEIEDFTPIEYAKDYKGNLVPVTHMYCHDLYSLISVDLMKHNVPEMLKLLKEKTGVEPTADDIADNAELLKAIKEGNTDSIPEMCTEYVRKMIAHIKPEKFSDFVAVSGLSHGTDVYEGNAKDLFAEGVCDFSNIIAFREDILLYLDNKRKEYTEKTGKEAPLSYLDCYKISEITRKGRAKQYLPEYEDALKEIGVPEWYIESAKKIRYLFPKAHSVEYMIASFKLLWYKLNYPNEFQEADYEVNGIIPTGFKKLDEILKGGFRKGDLILIRSKKETGAGSLARQIVGAVSRRNIKVAYFSYEKRQNQIKKLMLRKEFFSDNIIVNGTSTINIELMRYTLERINADIAVMDYYDVMIPYPYSEIKGNIAYNLRKLSEEFNIPIIVTKRESIYEFETETEQETSVIISANIEKDSNAAQIIVAKNAYGNIGTIDATFDSEKRLFKEV